MCKNICLRYRYICKTTQLYLYGNISRCSFCGVNMKYDGRFCPCCGTNMKHNPKNSGNKHKKKVHKYIE